MIKVVIVIACFAAWFFTSGQSYSAMPQNSGESSIHSDLVRLEHNFEMRKVSIEKPTVVGCWDPSQ